MSESAMAFAGLRVEFFGKGPLTLILLHGMGASNHSWRRWIPTLAGHHRVVALELAGFGSSPLPAEGDLSPPGQARRVGDFLASQVDSPFVLVGHSLGGAVATLVGLDLIRGRHPRPSQMRGLALVSAPLLPQRLPPILWAARVPGLGELFPLVTPPAWLLRFGIRQIVGRSRCVDNEMVAGYHAPIRNRARRHAMLQAARQLRPEALDEIIRGYPTLTLPILLLWGALDRVVPASTALRVQSLLPNAQCAILPGVGHLPAEEAPEESLAALLAFLRRIESRALLPADPHPALAQEGVSHPASDPKGHPKGAGDFG
jgi:pimeloyl-ACP methyl ester carboxylesterase